MEKLLSVKEAAEYLGLKENTVREWLRSGALKGIKIGKSWRIKISDLEALIDEKR